MLLNCKIKSGRRDLNPRSPAPKAGALANYATPRNVINQIRNYTKNLFFWQQKPSVYK